MKTFYSIIYVPLKQESKERLAVGLFMRNENELFFAYSKFKLNIVKELLSKSGYELLSLNLRNIDRTVNTALKEKNELAYSLYSKTFERQASLKESYFGYLSRYSNNLLGFSTPMEISIEANLINFKALFSKLVDEKHFLASTELGEVDVVEKTRSTLKPLIKGRVNWDFEITKTYVPNLILPSVHMDFAGKNEILVSGQAVDFGKRYYFLENDISKHIVLLDAMRQANENSTCFVLGKEPNRKEHPKNHHIWKNVVDEQRIEFVDADEYERVTDYMVKHDVKPLV